MTPHEPMGETGWSADDAGPPVRGADWEGFPPPATSYVPAVPISFGRFLDPLDMRLLTDREDGRETWMLLRPFRYQSSLWSEVIEVPAGEVHDAESVPLILRSFVGTPSTRAGVIHDHLYKVHRPDDRDLADRIYYECMLTDGVHVVDAEKRMAAVSFYGHSAWESGPSRLRVVATL